MTAFAVTGVLLSAGFVAVPSIPTAAAEGPQAPDPGVSVPGKDAGAWSPSPISDVVPPKPREAELPEGGTATVQVADAPSTAAQAALDGMADAVTVGGLPVGLTQAGGTDLDELSVEVSAPDADSTAPVVVTLAAPDGTASVGAKVTDTPVGATSTVDLQVDYSAFGERFGGSYADRLTLVELPSCAATAPQNAACAIGTPVQTENRTAEDTLVARDIEIATDGAPTVLAVTADVSGDKGTYGASGLSAAGTWSTDLRSGSFSWNYPIDAPDVPGSFVPELGISYSSGGIDGRTASTNNQGSLVGDGFDLWPGYIERKYKSCAMDDEKNDAGRPIGDLCWDYDNAFISFNGMAGELVPDGQDTWRLAKDDGTTIERLKDTARSNTDADGEYWKVTTPNGTQYFFGYNRLPGWETGDPATSSVWSVPVVGNDTGDPCSTSADKWCMQGWRWNLDYAVDNAGNKITYHYNRESNRYGLLGEPASDTAYARGGSLARIEYGIRGTDLVGTGAAQPLGRVVFTNSQRCLSDGSGQCTDITAQPSGWHDTPWDLNCASGTTCDAGRTSPSFWTRVRLTGVKTELYTGGAWKAVDSWALGHRWGMADADYQLLLASIRRTGHTGPSGATTIAMPPVEFDYDEMRNRMDRDDDGQAPFYKMRLTTIADEMGGQVDVTYSAEACQATNLPTPQTNTTRCFPQKRKPGPELAPVTDWFNKYVVTEVTTTDRTGQAPPTVTRYDYLGGAAWHWDESTGMVPAEEKTWSDWRGYGHVRTTSGDRINMTTQAESWFLRGMHGDRATPDGGSKSEVIELGTGEGDPITDAEQHAGFTYKTATFSGTDGSVVSKTVNRPWWHQTAISERSWGDIKSGFSGVGTSTTWTSLGTGGAPWRTTETQTSYDTVAGRVTQVDDRGDTSTSADNRCFKTDYVTNTTMNILGMQERQRTWGVSCAATPDYAGGDVISDVRYAYDGQNYGVAPVRGRITRTADLSGYDGTVAEYVEASASFETFGRPTSVTDVSADLRVTDHGNGTLTRTARTDGHKSTTTYTPTTGFATEMVETAPPATAGGTGLATTTLLDPVRGVPTRVTDANGKATNIAYDALGRTTKVWLADRVTSQTPSTEFTYRVQPGQAAAVGTTTLNRNGDPRTSWTLYDGLLRPIQTQDPGPDGGMILADTHYDARGLVARTYNPYYTTAVTPGRLFDPYEKALVDGQVRTTYDGLGRPTVSRLMRNDGDDGEVLSTTRTVYRGDRTTVIPPVGGTATTAIVDARGRTVELRQHHDRASANPDDTTGFDRTRYTYTGRDELATVVDPESNRWEYTYDQRGRQVRTVDPDAGVTTSMYDDFGRVVSTTDAENRTLVNVYDGLGRPTELREGSATGTLRSSWTYDTVSGAKGHPATSVRHENGAQYVTRVLEYDRLYRPVTTLTQIPEEEGALAGNYVSTVGFAPSGAMTGIGMPAAGSLPGQAIVYEYDTDTGWQTGSLGANGITSSLDYDNVGHMTHFETSAGVSGLITATYSYDRTTDRLLEYRADRFSQPGIDRSETYEYDQAGNITSLADVSRTGTDTQCFDYDHLARLTGAWTQDTGACAASGQAAENAGTIGGPAPYWNEYTYDKVGSRQTETNHGIAGSATPGDVTRTYSYDPAQPHTARGVVEHTAAAAGNPEVTASESYTYNAVGQTIERVLGGDTQTLSWTPEGRVDEVANADGTGSEYLYDAEGTRLISRNTTTDEATGEPVTETTLYLGHTEVTVSDAEPTVAKATRYMDVGGGHIAVMDDTGAVTFNLADHQGTGQLSVRTSDMALTQRRTAPFGEDRGEVVAPGDWAGSRGFVGGYDDRETTGLVSLGAREYDPALGRFISLDPVMDLSDPQQIHGYSYANNNPITLSDPTGLKPDDCATITCRSTPGGGWEVTNPTNEYVDNDYLDGDPSDDCYYYGCGGGSSSGGSGSDSGHSGGSAASGVGSAGGAAKGPTQEEIERAQAVMDKSITDVAMEMGWELLKDFVGWNDLQGCLNADIMSCGMLAMGITPWGKGLKAIKVLYKVVDGAMAFYKKQKMARRLLDEVSAARKAPSCNSFVPGTLVLMADGTKKPIEDVELGDEVLAADEETGEVTGGREVSALITGRGDKTLVTITVEDESGRAQQLVATDEHPFWVPDLREWVDAIDLTAGDWLQTASGTWVEVTAIDARSEPAVVHNLTVGTDHTYYVTADETTAAILTHNASCPLPGTGFGVPNSPGVYTIHLDDGTKYVGKANTSMRDRANASAGSSHALAAAGKKPGEIVNITWVELPAGNGSTYYRTAEQTIMDGLMDQGVTLLNRRNPEIHLKYGGILD
ncbi:polymorphic toxin-type HINT domain-containing protein [Promicromonospora sp. NPDC052451]|uniref:polymorphic toxin-type HINT domain-containing protein n=1 Tax=Promicromonospora sp. NPDC052451 TaxID=3364407 RepID=UPI0037CA2752